MIEDKEWFPYDGIGWPDCNPSDEIEFSLRSGISYFAKAGVCIWAYNSNKTETSSDVVKWRYDI